MITHAVCKKYSIKRWKIPITS